MHKWRDSIESLKPMIDEIMPGKELQVCLSLCALFSSGHILVEDNPGMGKTTLAHFIAHISGLEFSRIQFTNDLLPSDILGSSIFHPQKVEFEFRKGAIFTEFLLADELNRAPSKTQSALLQGMEERLVSIEGRSYPLSPLFFVMATQNPKGMGGTFSLPESQLDRFMMKFSMGFPPREAELGLLVKSSRREAVKQLPKVFSPQMITEIRGEIENKVFVSNELANYVLRLLERSRQNTEIRGLSSRAGIDIIKASKSWAWMHAREHVLPEDVKDLFGFIAGHRLPYQELGHPHEAELANLIVKDVSVIA
jgi:MoxR-like ATPase